MIKKSDYEEFLKQKKKQLWLCLPLKVFRFDEVELYGVYCCPECESMAGITGLATYQAPDVIRDRLCIHSRVASSALGNWRDLWSVSMSVSQEQAFNVCFNKDITCEVFIPHESKEECFLAAVYHNRKISLLYCATQRQEVPFCSHCVRRKYNHCTILTNFQNKEKENDNQDYMPSHDVEEEEPTTYDDNYMKVLPNHIRGYLYGYNYTPIVYAFRDSPEQQSVWLDRMRGSIEIPEQLIPVYDPSLKCKHDVQFNPDEKFLVEESKSLCLFTDLGDRILSSRVLARPSSGPCICLQRYDGHPYLI